MENEFTKGKWITDGINILSESNNTIAQCYDDSEVGIDEWTEKNRTEAEANTQLIADAGNVRQQINFGLTELLKQRNEMLEAMQDFVETVKSGGSINMYFFEKKFKEVIKEATTI